MGLGIFLTHSIASSFDFTWMSQKPAISSFVSAKGPSITVRLDPEKRTRAPFELGCNPSPASITPAFTSSSLNFPISARSFSSGRMPASEFLSALTMTMNRIERILRGSWQCAVLPLRRTSCHQIDTARRALEQLYVFHARGPFRKRRRRTLPVELVNGTEERRVGTQG